MSVHGQIVAQLSRFDDEAYAALANRGLLRRAQKDLEKQEVSVVEEVGDSLTLGFGDHRIRFDVRGPAHAQCSCPAAGICQHIIAAAIGLQRMSQAEEQVAPAPSGEAVSPAAGVIPAGTDSPQRSSESSLQSLREELLRIGVTQLRQHAGKAGYRWAWQFVQDLDPEEGLRISGDRNIVIGFAVPRMTFRYMGGGIDSLVADVSTAQIEKYRVAAILGYQRAFGVAIAAPEQTGKPRSEALDLGKDHAGRILVSESQMDSRTRLLMSTRKLIEESISLGLSHLSQGIQERYSTLAVWAQGADYFRLALLLRRIADHVELLLGRAGGADEHRLLDELSIAYALIAALEDASRKGLAPSHLLGRGRSKYQDTGVLELMGLGAHSWRSGSGYVGLTMLFWAPEEDAFFSCTDARPEGLGGFNPMARYKSAGPWSGLGAPAQATGRHLTLTGAQLAAAGRLSASEKTSATIRNRSDGAPFASRLKTYSNWTELERARASSRRSLLSEPDPMKDWFVLQPSKSAPAKFDSARQVMVWPLHDAEGAVVLAELAYSEHTAHAIGRVEALAADGWPAGTLLVARLRSQGGGIIADPLSLVRSADSDSPVDALHFDEAPKLGLSSRLMAKFRINPTATIRPTADAVRKGAPIALINLRDGLQRHAERGAAHDAGAAGLDRPLRAEVENAQRAGLTLFADTKADPQNSPAWLVRMHYICMQYDRLLSDQSQQME